MKLLFIIFVTIYSTYCLYDIEKQKKILYLINGYNLKSYNKLATKLLPRYEKLFNVSKFKFYTFSYFVIFLLIYWYSAYVNYLFIFLLVFTTSIELATIKLKRKLTKYNTNKLLNKIKNNN